VDNKYSYAPLEEIVKTIGSVVNAAGFSYRWSEEDLPIQVVEIEGKQRQLKKSKRYWFILSGFGHEERNYVDLPEGVDNPIANDAQKRGSSMSYGRRYSMIAGLGIVFEGEDDDGALSFSGDEVGEMAIQIAELKKASSLEELKQIYIPMAKAAKDEREKALLANIKNQVKAELQEIADAGN
jgi:ATP-dependent DNA ligase